MAPEPALRLRGITKKYGTVIACDNVDLTVERGEIHGLLGENGAGKSTLMRILLGLETRDAGTVARDGHTVTITGPRDAAAHGIGMVHQHLSLIDPLTVWENVVLGDPGPVRRAAARAGVRAVAEHYGLVIDPDAPVGTLSAGERQRVELIKCLRRDPAVLIMDEPTSVLTRAESAELFTVLRRAVTAEDRAVVLISHKLTEITTATDRVTVMRAGRVVLRRTTAATTETELARQMIDRETTTPGTPPHPTPPAAPAAPGAALRLTGLTVPPGLNDLHLTVQPGEIAGLYGPEGNGQKTLEDILSGLTVPHAGTVEIAGTAVDLHRPGALTAAGLGIVPEDRHRTGIIADLNVAQNLLMTRLGDVSGRVLIDRRRLHRQAQALVDEYGITTHSLDTPLRHLSGGNQQRVVLARALSGRPRVLVAAQPTHGLDVGAAEDLYTRLRRCAVDGIAVLIISTDLDELLALTTRLAVILHGRIVGELPTAQADPQQLGLLIGGAT
ncbi:ABC transporter ATP-binding protein [Catenuloplanes indicus]|uniref:Simple sugar transport system ATP-binding protein n=1 Tax=Catenuloplanes indicus TaxID=137267 RepID=A0AAE3VTU1_9ACTN|nr:ATP-binding cassette domain-containing protein [Catenuloplanes indicus]MDQ0363596.1 simple sugar transport system ATP-binding protein [Catenuloplanes indicus]